MAYRQSVRAESDPSKRWHRCWHCNGRGGSWERSPSGTNDPPASGGASASETGGRVAGEPASLVAHARVAGGPIETSSIQPHAPMFEAATDRVAGPLLRRVAGLMVAVQSFGGVS